LLTDEHRQYREVTNTETTQPAITAFTHHQIAIQQWEETEDILTSGCEENA